MSSKQSSLLSVNGARFSQKNGSDIISDRGLRAGDQTSPLLQHINSLSAPVANMSRQLLPSTSASSNAASSATTSYGGASAGSRTNGAAISSERDQDSVDNVRAEEPVKYWKQPAAFGNDDLVTIHVCDENQQINRDFCCKRDILVAHMKYFEKFLSQNDNGYDDIDISVHCDAEIFEWLMAYIHEPDKDVEIDKSIIVSILISSEFLQIDSLVELCVQQVSRHLNEIIKLPIDLSCISEKLINRIAFITHPKTLAEARDRKDKILTKLYKRRVELDFSRKGSSSSNSSTKSGVVRTIAASLTCCRYCGSVYLDNYVAFLSCKNSPPTIDFRGGLASRHSAIAGWSLTSYLKTLHAGGMGWDAIYWHVWAACTVLRADSVVVSALEVDRYTIEPDGLLIRGAASAFNGDDSSSPAGRGSPAAGGGGGAGAAASSGAGDDAGVGSSPASALGRPPLPQNSFGSNMTCTTSLNPHRPPEVLTKEIYDLLCSQMKYITGLSHKQLLQNTMRSMVANAKASVSTEQLVTDFAELLYGSEVRGRNVASGASFLQRRGRSVPNRGRSGSQNGRKNKAAAAASSNGSDNNSDSDDYDSGREVVEGDSTASASARVSFRSRSLSSHKLNKALTSKGLTLTDGTTSESDTNNEKSKKDGFDFATLQRIAVLRSFPPDVYQKLILNKGRLLGETLSQQPLACQSQQQFDILESISLREDMQPNKRFEWNMDVLREYDDKRMDRYETFLVAHRDHSLSVGGVVGGRGGGVSGLLTGGGGGIGGGGGGGLGGAGPGGASGAAQNTRRGSVVGGKQLSTLNGVTVAAAIGFHNLGGGEYYKDRARQAWRNKQ